MEQATDLEVARQALGQIRPHLLEYDEWLAVGMALRDAGADVAEWDEWSRADNKRYRPNECAKKWSGFNRGGGVGIGTLVKLCRDHGGDVSGARSDDGDEAFDWSSPIGGGKYDLHQPKVDELKVVKTEWLQDAELPPEPASWDGRDDLRRYLAALFQAEEHVCIVTGAWQSEPDGEGHRKWLPKKGDYSRTAGEIIQELAGAKDVGEVIGDPEPEAGAWVRANPLDGLGVADANVTAYRHVLVESDEISIERQYAIYQQLELPVAALVHSGGKSLHAIVKIDAPDFKEYQKRVDFLYDVCKRNGLQIDRKNRNPSRLSRLPGVLRNGNRQRLVAVNVGKGSWQEWAEWIAAVNDDLPDVECLSDVLTNLPPLSLPLIHGVLRQGHKLLLAGSSKAGKSFLLLQLCVALAEGREWLGFKCEKGRVLYVNLELDRASCYHRLAAVYRVLGIPPAGAENIDVWNLRGKALPMDALAPKLIRRALKRRYVAVVIDPIYKVITGDENAADQMAKFCNQFDRVCHELGSAVIYCHHHSKGDQGGKRAADRASGSGVFARDPDAMLDLLGLPISDQLRKQLANRWECDALAEELDRAAPGWRNNCPQDDAIVADKLGAWAVSALTGERVATTRAWAREEAEAATGWRMEGVLREFAGFKPRRFWFSYPRHRMDDHGLLDGVLADGEEQSKRTPKEAGKAKAEDHKADTVVAVEAVRGSNGLVTLEDVVEYLGLGERAVRYRLRDAGFMVKNGLVKGGAEIEENS